MHRPTEPNTGSLDDLHRLITSSDSGTTSAYKRQLIAIAGPPGSGKSTTAAALQARLGDTAMTVPMDGFHHDNDWLDTRGLRHRKGAPETFDVAGLITLLDRLCQDTTTTASPDMSPASNMSPESDMSPASDSVIFPTFDRDRDQVIEDGGVITSAHRIILLEGNYLLLTKSPWDAVSTFCDLHVMLSVPRSVLKSRLETRWRTLGHDESDIRQRVDGNDLINADYVLAHSHQANFILQSPEPETQAETPPS